MSENKSIEETLKLPQETKQDKMKDKLSNKLIAIEYKSNYWINMSLLNKYSITKYNAKILNKQVTVESNFKQN